jgi:hypothetical protein
MEKLRSPSPAAARHGHVAGHFAAHAHALALGVAFGNGVGHQAQHGGVQRVVQVRHRLVGAVDGQRVLDQVVGADGQEVEVLQEQCAASAPPPAPRSSRPA